MTGRNPRYYGDANTSAAWRLRAACAETDPALFFPDPGGRLHAAKAICAGCEVREPCLAEGLRQDAGKFGGFGIWGGLTVKERERLRGRR